MQRIKPLGNRVLVKIDPVEQKKGSLIMLESSQERQNKGTAMVVGIECENIKTGDRVMFNKYAGNQVFQDCEDLILMLEDEIFAKFEE